MTSAADAAPSRRTPRRHAVRNRESLLRAARAAFARQGLETSLERIAADAGVGIGTLYRHFPTRAELIDAVLADTVQEQVDAAERALLFDDPWTGLVSFLHETTQIQANDRGLVDLMVARIPGAVTAEATKTRLYKAMVAVFRRAFDAGQIRADAVPEDLAFITWANRGVLEATATVAPDAWRRHLAIFLDGLHAGTAEPLPRAPLTSRQVYDAMVALGARSLAGRPADDQ